MEVIQPITIHGITMHRDRIMFVWQLPIQMQQEPAQIHGVTV